MAGRASASCLIHASMSTRSATLSPKGSSLYQYPFRITQMWRDSRYVATSSMPACDVQRSFIHSFVSGDMRVRKGNDMCKANQSLMFMQGAGGGNQSFVWTQTARNNVLVRRTYIHTHIDTHTPHAPSRATRRVEYTLRYCALQIGVLPPISGGTSPNGPVHMRT
jgi:hypothetical protein